ncbi:MAG: hypothetical protein NUV84_03010 [Candidatus Uhrbacteria bacterium]|nr:hypothetical protein [Candidatus Uhrbacteria bacterium]
MATLDPLKYAQEYKERCKKMSDEQLIDAFNQQVGVNAWGTARSLYLAAIHNEFIERGYNYSDIGSKGGLSFAGKIKLESGKISIIA